MATEDSYGAALRRALRDRQMSIRDLERRLKGTGGRGYSYEHIRKVCAGMPVQSEHFNEVVSKELGLDTAEMWQLALRAKATSGSRSAIIASSLAASAPAPELRAVWSELTGEDQARATRFILGLAEQRRAERLETTSDDPEAIRDAIIRLTQRLSNTAASGSGTRKSHQRRDEAEPPIAKARIAGKR